MRMTLDHISLPEDEGNKPAEVTLNDGTENVELPDNPNPEPDQTPAESDQPASPEQSPAPEQKDGSEEDGDANDNPPGQTETPAEPVNADTPWHKNPEWQQMVERSKQAQAEAEALKAQIEELKAQSTPPAPPVDLRDPNEIAEERLVAKYEGGWKPKDQLEQLREYNKIKDQVIDEQNDYRTQETRRTQESLTKVYESEGLTPEQVALVKSKSIEWVQRGLIAEPAVIAQEAINYLKDTGAIKKAGDEPSLDNPKKIVKTETPRPTANSKISRPSASGENVNAKPQKDIRELKKMGLEGIILSHQDELSK